MVDDAGRIAAEFVYHDRKKSWDLKSLKNDRLTPVMSADAAIDVPSVLGFGVDGDTVLMQFLENGNAVWKPLSLRDGSWGAPLAEGAVFHNIVKERKTGRIVGGLKDVDASRYVFFDTELQAHWNAVLRAFPGERVELASHSDDFTKFICQGVRP